MTDTNTAEREAAEQWLRDRYGAYRGHFAWRELEEAFLAGRASLAASEGSNEGSESVVADGWLHENGLLYRLTDERHPCNRDEINVTMADGSRSIESRSRRALELLDRIRATHPSPPEGIAAEQALRNVLAEVQRYMPPDGPSAQDTMSEIIAIVDPWPLEGMAGWISLSEQQPEDGVLKLFCNMKAESLAATFFVDWMVGGKFCGNRHNSATHYQELPPFPASEAKEL